MIDYYEILGTDETATQDQIKTAYKIAAKKYHPDVNDAPNAAAFFRLIQEAYETLSDPEKREQYDSDCNNTEDQSSYEKNYENYSSYGGGYQYTYEPESVPDHIDDDRRKNIPLIDSIMAIAAVMGILNFSTHLHLAFCFLIGLAFAVLLAALFQTRVGWWVISVIYSAIWALLGGAIAGAIFHDDWIWFWTGYGIAFLIALAQHRFKTKK